ncbi:hypothetical protein RclHR1_41200001 [Rhizophagus clarus]|uniref:Uncharacterized protein n=1 Tax=Rhizophagus clarus TaxID=94130 RepID=A0A2Z6RXX7_9GLOM|nr:hypothetical protein RclHR1_41200001 [Rhizophagus clarus]GES79360.1 hypothetical protein RCL_e17788_RclHR1_41200001 [Rhizophagus clarus]
MTQSKLRTKQINSLTMQSSNGEGEPVKDLITKINKQLKSIIRNPTTIIIRERLGTIIGKKRLYLQKMTHKAANQTARANKNNQNSYKTPTI